MIAAAPLDGKSLGATGLYSAFEASRLTGVPARTIRDWLTVRSLWKPRIEQSSSAELFLDFLDLLEIRVVSGLRRRRVSLQKIRAGIRHIQNFGESSHPLISGRLFLEWRRNRHNPMSRLHVGDRASSSDRKPGVVDVQTGQFAWHELLKLDDVRELDEDDEGAPPLRGRDIEKMLDEGIMFSVGVRYHEDGSPYQWRPTEEAAPEVVLDPLRAFGKPIIDRRGVPTSILAQMTDVYSRDEIIREMGVTPNEFDQAVRFERELCPA